MGSLEERGQNGGVLFCPLKLKTVFAITQHAKMVVFPLIFIDISGGLCYTK